MKVSLVRARYPSVWEPTNLMYVSSYIKKYFEGDLDVKILDGYFDSDEHILSQVSDSDYVGLSGTTPQVPHMLKLLKLIKKENNNIKTVVGGYGYKKLGFQTTEYLSFVKDALGWTPKFIKFIDSKGERN